jgi:hypothetical protein
LWCIPFILLALWLSASIVGAEDVRERRDRAPQDAFAEALRDIGLRESQIGQRPKALWNRYPHPNTIPYLLPFFADLHARPLDAYEFTRTLGNAVKAYLSPSVLEEDGAALYKLAVLLATERRIGGFRAYGANLDPRSEAADPLLNALLALWERAGQPLDRRVVFGKDTEETDDPHAELRSRVEQIPRALHEPLAKLVLNLLDARQWIDLGLRRVTQDLRDGVFDALPELVQTTPGARRFFPPIEDTARLIDEHSLWYGCLKAVQATHDARREIGGVLKRGKLPRFDFELATPWGKMVVDQRSRNELILTDSFLVVRLKSGKSLRGVAGATGRRRPLSVALLFDASTSVGCGEDKLSECEPGTVASGVLGCGIVLSAGKRGNDYRAGRWGLGAGLFGLGLLVDEGGDDEYRMRSVGMGAGYFGAGLMLDAAGDDRYHLEEGDGQGYGGPNGIGVLADRFGDDRYYSEPDPRKAGRPDYHSQDRIAVSHAQGVGVGRRGDGSDGHVWAGGLGALIDVEGDDKYRAGNFSMGLGYWFGTGLLWDGAGRDEYRSVYFTQGAGAHFAIGTLVDEGGDDKYLLEETAGAGLGFGWDDANALLIDRGGDDRYEARIDSLGVAMVRSHALFIDEGGDDEYVLAAGARGFGDVDEPEEYTQPRRTAPFPYHLKQLGLFLDCDGDDRYLRADSKGRTNADPEATDDGTWHVRRRDPTARHGHNLSIGRDVILGRIGFLDPWPPR